nr:MAG TPA: hypothetical protein [Caudoviricetes sp.]
MQHRCLLPRGVFWPTEHYFCIPKFRGSHD